MINKRVVNFCKTLRDGLPEAKIYYSFGACYEFYKLLKILEPKSVAVIDSDEDGDHIGTLIDGRIYDVNGVIPLKHNKVFKKMTTEDHEVWERNMKFSSFDEIINVKFPKIRKEVYED